MKITESIMSRKHSYLKLIVRTYLIVEMEFSWKRMRWKRSLTRGISEGKKQGELSHQDSEYKRNKEH